MNDCDLVCVDTFSHSCWVFCVLQHYNTSWTLILHLSIAVMATSLLHLWLSQCIHTDYIKTSFQDYVPIIHIDLRYFELLFFI